MEGAFRYLNPQTSKIPTLSLLLSLHFTRFRLPWDSYI